MRFRPKEVDAYAVGGIKGTKGSRDQEIKDQHVVWWVSDLVTSICA